MPAPGSTDLSLALTAAVSALSVSLGVSVAGEVQAEPLHANAPAGGCKHAAEKPHPVAVPPVRPSTPGVEASRARLDPSHVKVAPGAGQVAAVKVRGYDSHQMKQVSPDPKCSPGGGKP